MLDDLKLIHERDPQDALGIAEKQWQQLHYDFGIDWKPSNPQFDLRSIAVAGMGGSALSAAVLQAWPKTMVPFEIVRDYALPHWVGSDTLFIASSYSGNTEETLSALHEAESRDCEIVIIASGGSLAARAEEKGYPIFRLPTGLQPRHAVLYSLAALVQLLAGTGVIGGRDKIDEMKKAGDWLHDQINAWIPTAATAQNRAKQIALECIGKSIVIYGGPLMFPAAYKWKISFNENAKHVAWCNSYSEFNHNEFIGWSKQPVEKPYTVIDLRSNLEHPQIQKRFEISAKLLSGLRPDPIVVKPEGETLLEQLLWTIALGDFVTLYTALLNNIDPTPVDLIEKLKKELA